MKREQTTVVRPKAGKEFLKGLVTLGKPLWTNWNEVVLNIATESLRGVPISPPNPARPWWRTEFSEKAAHDDGCRYASPDYWYVRKVANILRPGPQDVFYDLGSGMGRILCVIARRHLRKCVGVELFEPLCEVARRNADRLRGRKSPIEIICEDAAKANLSDGTIYFMFNPFGPDTIRDVIENIRRSLSNNPRTVTIVYYNARHEPALEAGNWLEQFYQFATAGGLRVSFWRNRRLEEAKLSGPGKIAEL